MAKKAKKKKNRPAHKNTSKQPMTTAEIREAKKKRSAAAKRNRGNLKEYFKGVKTEMKKVVWPTRKELGSYTVVVVAVCAAFALAFWLVDTGFLAVLRGILGITLTSS